MIDYQGQSKTNDIMQFSYSVPLCGPIGCVPSGWSLNKVHPDYRRRHWGIGGTFDAMAHNNGKAFRTPDMDTRAGSCVIGTEGSW